MLSRGTKDQSSASRQHAELIPHYIMQCHREGKMYDRHDIRKCFRWMLIFFSPPLTSAAAGTVTGNWTHTRLSQSLRICQTMHVPCEGGIYMQLSLSSGSSSQPTNKVIVWYNIGILYNQRLTWIEISSFDNDFVPSGQVTLFPKRVLRINVTLGTVWTGGQRNNGGDGQLLREHLWN